MTGLPEARTAAHGNASGMTAEGPHGLCIVADPDGDARHDVPGNPFGISADALRVMRALAPSAISPDSWPASPDAWGRSRALAGTASNGLPHGQWLATWHPWHPRFSGSQDTTCG